MTDAAAKTTTDARLQAASVWCLKLAEGTLPSGERALFEAWNQADPENRLAFEDAVGVWRAIRDTSATAELLTLRREALASFEHANRQRWKRPRAFRLIPGIAAAMLVAVGALSAWFYFIPTDYHTDIGERRVIALTDGSRISLDATTEVTVRYSGRLRVLRLVRGRAKFEVAKDSHRPFTVAVADKIVRATGTAFSVELVQDEIQVILYEGHVDILSAEDSIIPAAPFTHGEVLTPGHELIVPVTGSAAEIEVADPARSLAWESGQLVFTREPLASAIERINRYSDQRLQIGDAEAGRILIDGVFTAGDTDAFIEGVTGVFPLRLKQSDGGRVLVSAR